MDQLEVVALMRDDLPLPPGPRHRPLTTEARARTQAVFETLEFRSLLPRLDALPAA